MVIVLKVRKTRDAWEIPSKKSFEKFFLKLLKQNFQKGLDKMS